MRYFKYRWNWAPGDEVSEWGDSCWYYEFDTDNTITRQIIIYDSGYRLRYGPDHSRDDYGVLPWDVTLDEFDPSLGEEISQERFEALWETGPWTNDPIDAVARLFPEFARLAVNRGLDHLLPPATAAQVAVLEERLVLPLPESYKGLLRCSRGFWLMGGVVQFESQHPFFHEFPPFDTLTVEQKQIVAIKGGPWPPASQGMLCFAEFFMEADGDQVLFDTHGGLVGGEYPIVYWAHEGRPPSVRLLAASFADFMDSFLEYPAFK